MPIQHVPIVYGLSLDLRSWRLVSMGRLCCVRVVSRRVVSRVQRVRWMSRVRMHRVWRVRRVLRMRVGWRRRGSLELGDMGGDNLVLPFMLQLSKDVLANAVLVKFGLYVGYHVVDDGAVDGGLTEAWMSLTALLRTHAR